MARKYPESVARKCAEILDALRSGSSLVKEAGKLRGENMTPYTKAQVMYALILFFLQNRDTSTNLAFDFILDWRREILRDGLFANASIPDDVRMSAMFSRPSWTDSKLWEAQGHEHQTDGLSLLERIYAVHEQIAEKYGQQPGFPFGTAGNRKASGRRKRASEPSA